MSKENIEIVRKIVELLNQLLVADETFREETKTDIPETVEMLTVRECTEAVKWLSEYTVRQLVKSGKLPFIRTGEGKRGKILINKTDLISCFH